MNWQYSRVEIAIAVVCFGAQYPRYFKTAVFQPVVLFQV